MQFTPTPEHHIRKSVDEWSKKRSDLAKNHGNKSMVWGFTLLGTGPASPIPRIYCKCPVCTDARKPESKSRRSRSSALLTVNGRPASRTAAQPFGSGAPANSAGRHILFDAGPDVLQQLDREKTYAVDAVFFTHAHNDAVGGFFDLKDLLFRQKHPAVLYVEPETWKKISSDVPKKEIWFKVKFIVPNRPLMVFGVPITPFRVLHAVQPDFPTLGYRIGDQLVYASDVKSVPKSSERFIAGIKYAVLDGCFWFGTKFPTHLTVDETIAVADRLRVKNLYLTQISHNYPPYAEAQKVITQYVEQQHHMARVSLAYDGMRIKLSTTNRKRRTTKVRFTVVGIDNTFHIESRSGKIYKIPKLVSGISQVIKELINKSLMKWVDSLYF